MLHTPTGSLSVELAKRKELDCIEQELTEKAALLETRKRELEAELEQIKKARKAILREAARQHISIGRLFKMRLRDFYRMVRTNELQYSRVAYREAAAITIQTAWRASLASDFVNVLRKAKGMQPRIRFAQFQVTGKASVQQLQDMLEALSDAQMEGVPTAVRRELKIALEKHLTEKAAVSVQKAFRGHRARHVTVPQTKNYRDEWQEFWSDDGKDDGADVRSRASSSVNKLGQPSLLTTDSVAASSTSRARTSHSYEAYNDSHYGRHEDLDENQKGGAAEFRSVSWQEQQQQNDDEARRGSAAFSGAYQEATAGLESVDNAQFKEWPDAPVEQDEALPTQEGDQSAAEVAYDAPYSPYSAGATEGALSPLETVSGAAAALQESGFVCLTDLDDLSALAPGLQLKMVRSDGTATDVELIGIVSGDNYRVRGRCNDGKIVVKKLKYFFTVPTELLALANEDSFSQETVENVKAQVGTWDICVDEEGNEFYYNRLSGESVWDKPAEVLAAEVEGSLGMSRPRSNPRDSTSSQKPSRGLGKLPKRGGKKKRGKRHQSFDMDELSEVTSPSSPAPATPSYDSNARFDVFF